MITIYIELLGKIIIDLLCDINKNNDGKFLNFIPTIILHSYKYYLVDTSYFKNKLSIFFLHSFCLFTTLKFL